MKYKQVIYTSEKVDDFKVFEVIEMLKKARENNFEIGVSGILLYGNGYFIQLVEGNETVIGHLYKKIEADKRHTNTKIISDIKKDELHFTKWSMGFIDLSSNEKNEGALKILEKYGQAKDFNPNNFDGDSAFKFLQEFRSDIEKN